MNVFNRTAMIFVTLILLIAAFVLTVWPYTWTAVGETMTRVSGDARLGYALGGILVMLVCGLVFLLEVRRPRRSKYVVVDRVAGGEARVAVDSVSRRLNYQVDILQDVSEVKSRIVARRRALHVNLDIIMSPDVDVPMKTDEVLETTRRVIGEDMGLKLAGKLEDSITITIRHPKQISTWQRELPAVTTEAPAELPEFEFPPEVEEPEPAAAEPEEEESWPEES